MALHHLAAETLRDRLTVQGLRVIALKQHVELAANKVQPHFVFPAPWNDNVGPAFGWLDKFQMHGFDRGLVLAEDVLDITATLLAVAPNPPDQAIVIVGIDENHHIEQAAQFAVGINQNAFDDEDGRWMDLARGGFTGVQTEIVFRDLDWLTCF